MRLVLLLIAFMSCAANGLRCYSTDLYLDSDNFTLDSSLLVECPAQGSVSCTSYYDPTYGIWLSCSSRPCLLDGEPVNNTAACREDTIMQTLGRSNGSSENCCCYGDGCNRNVRQHNFLDEGIAVAVDTTCSIFPGPPYVWADLEYSEGPLLLKHDSDVEYVDGVMDLYPNGTILTARCYKGHPLPYMSNAETSRASKVTSVWSATCLNGNWVSDDGTVPCEKVTEDDVVSGEAKGSQPSSLAESIARRIERFYDKASRPERTFLKRLIKRLDVVRRSQPWDVNRRSQRQSGQDMALAGVSI